MISFRQYYDGTQPPMPTFEKFLMPPPVLERHLVQESLQLVPQLAVDYEPSVFFEGFNKMCQETSQVNIHFTKEQLTMLQTVAMAQAGSKVSVADALAAYLIDVHNRITGYPVQQIINYMDASVSLPSLYSALLILRASIAG